MAQILWNSGSAFYIAFGSKFIYPYFCCFIFCAALTLRNPAFAAFTLHLVSILQNSYSDFLHCVWLTPCRIIFCCFYIACGSLLEEFHFCHVYIHYFNTLKISSSAVSTFHMTRILQKPIIVFEMPAFAYSLIVYNYHLSKSCICYFHFE